MADISPLPVCNTLPHTGPRRSGRLRCWCSFLCEHRAFSGPPATDRKQIGKHRPCDDRDCVPASRERFARRERWREGEDGRAGRSDRERDRAREGRGGGRGGEGREMEIKREREREREKAKIITISTGIVTIDMSFSGNASQ